jgi:hypothetical protein
LPKHNVGAVTLAIEIASVNGGSSQLTDLTDRLITIMAYRNKSKKSTYGNITIYRNNVTKCSYRKMSAFRNKIMKKVAEYSPTDRTSLNAVTEEFSSISFF